MRHAPTTFAFFSGCALLAALTCSRLAVTGGGGTEWEAKITGRVVDSSGVSCANAIVRLIPSNYDPVTGSAISSLLTATTDNAGYYSMSTMQTGNFSLNIAAHDKGYRSLVTGISIAKIDTVIVQNAIARKSGTIKITLPAGVDVINGYYFIPGTQIYTLLEDNTTTVALDSVSADIGLPVYYAVKGGSAQPQLVRDSVIVAPGGIMNIENIGWIFSKKLILNTTASGANVAGTVTNFPVLIRLTSANLKFTEAQQGGADLRFTKADGSPLPFEIETWDGVNSAAAVWVKIDTVFGNDSAHYILMYYGNPKAVGMSSGAAVFDTAAGFQGVWHLGESGATSPDATLNHYDGTPSSPAPAQASGIIGNSQQFDGASTYISAAGTASGKLNFPEHGTYTVSAWVYVDTLDTLFHKIVEKNNVQYKLQIDQFKYWSFSELDNAHEYEMTNAPASAKEWVYVAGVRAGAMQYLYVNGQCVNSTITYGPYSGTRDTTTDVVIGNSSGNPLGCFFKGKIDEVRIQSVACSADWIKLCSMNQGARDALVLFRN
jgi:hypothetical protein